MTRWLALAALCCAPVFTATAADLTLTHQARVTDAIGEPINGTLPVIVELHSDDAQEALLWRAELTPTFVDGYATLLLDTGDDNATIDSSWFATPVWIDLTVDGTTLTPRSRVTDVPGAPQVKTVTYYGTTWDDPTVTAISGSTIDANGLTINAGSENDMVTQIDLARPGEFPNGARVEVEFLIERLTADADPTIYLGDRPDGTGPAPEACGIRVLDQSFNEFRSVVNGVFPGTAGAASGSGGSEASGVNPVALRAVWTLPPGTSGGLGGFMTGETRHGETRGQCPGSIHVQDGLVMYITRNNATERYRWLNLTVTMFPL